MMWMAIDTSGDRCSVALDTGSGVLLRETPAPRQHARSVAPFMQELLVEAGANRSDGVAGARAALAGIVVVAGPGSYTGLRIGVSSAKGLSFALGVPLYAVSTLDYLLDAATQRTDGVARPAILAVERARRGELHVGGPGLADQVMADGDFREHLATEHATLVVRDTRLADELIGEHFVTADRVLVVQPDARNALRIVRSAPHSYLVPDMPSFEPFYLKPFVSGSA
jgi:tRNA threonylcarbamoyladenosine biosynthesis protein TsaB